MLSACRTVFHRNRDAVIQLLKSCFTSTLGLGSGSIYNNGGVGALLGNGFVSQIPNGISPVAPGILYLRVYRSIGDITFLIEEIVPILMLSVTDIASSDDVSKKGVKKLKKTKFGTKYGQVSLARSMDRIKHAALVGASLIWMSGGPKSVQYLMIETLPSWFLSAAMLEHDGGESAMVAKLRGYALAYFVFLSAAFAWGIDNSHSPQRRAKIVGLHLNFLGSSLTRNIPLGCRNTSLEAYVSGLVSLMVSLTPSWVQELDENVLKSLNEGLRQMGEHELALRLLETGGIGVMGAAAEMIIQFERRS